MAEMHDEFTPGQLAIIDVVITRTIEKYSERMHKERSEQIETAILFHAKTCDTMLKVRDAKAWIMGAAAIGAVFGAAAVRVFVFAIDKIK